jgi:hypothetical protein
MFIQLFLPLLTETELTTPQRRYSQTDMNSQSMQPVGEAQKAQFKEELIMEINKFLGSLNR